MKKVLIRQAAGGFITKVLGAGFSFAIAILLARQLGAEAFGKYALVISGATIVATLSALGLPMLIVRQVAIYRSTGQWGNLRGIIRSAHAWTLLTVVIICLVVSIGQFWIPAEMMGGLWLGLLLVPLLAVNQIRAAALRGLNWVVLADVPELLIRPIVVLVSLGGAIYTNTILNEYWALGMQLMAAMVALTIGSVALRGRLPSNHGQVCGDAIKREWLLGGIAFLGVAVISLLEGQVALLSVGVLSGAKDAGIYQAISQMVSLLVFGLMAVNMALQPRLASAWAEGNKGLAQYLVTVSARLGGVVAVVVGFILFVFSEPFLALFGSTFVDGAIALRILIVGQLVNAASGPCGVVLSMTGYQKTVLQGAVLALGVNLVLCWMLIPQWKVSGAAIAASAGLLTWNIYLAIQAQKLIGINTTIFKR